MLIGLICISAGNMKMHSISGGTKILPKPSQPVYMVSSSTSPLSMVTRTIPASMFHINQNNNYKCHSYIFEVF